MIFGWKFNSSRAPQYIQHVTKNEIYLLIHQSLFFWELIYMECKDFIVAQIYIDQTPEPMLDKTLSSSTCLWVCQWESILFQPIWQVLVLWIRKLQPYSIQNLHFHQASMLFGVPGKGAKKETWLSLFRWRLSLHLFLYDLKVALVARPKAISIRATGK